MDDKDETNLFFKLNYNDQSEEIIPTKDFNALLTKICSVLPIEKADINFLEIYHNGNLIKNEKDYLNLLKSKEFQIDLTIVNKKNAKFVPTNLNNNISEKLEEKKEKENNEIDVNQILNNQNDNNNNEIYNLLNQINERINKMEQNINNKIAQESQNISLQIDEKINNLKNELINNQNITNTEVQNIKKNLTYLPQKINNIQQIVSDLSLLPNAFKENTNNMKYEINEMNKNMNNFFTQLSDFIKENNKKTNLNNYNQIKFNEDNVNNYPLIDENNNNFNVINNVNQNISSDDDDDDNKNYKLKIIGEELKYSYDQYNSGDLRFEMTIINEGECFPKHLKIKCEPNGVLYFDTLDIKIANINEKEYKQMIFLKKNQENTGLEGENFLLCNILDNKNRQLGGNLYNLKFN
jgi:hypothetical protein